MYRGQHLSAQPVLAATEAVKAGRSVTFFASLTLRTKETIPRNSPARNSPICDALHLYVEFERAKVCRRDCGERNAEMNNEQNPMRPAAGSASEFHRRPMS